MNGNKVIFRFSDESVRLAKKLATDGFILDMDVVDVEGLPVFRIITTNRTFKTKLDKADNIRYVNLILECVGTHQKVEFKDYGQYYHLIQAIFNEYKKRSDSVRVMYFDNTDLNATLERLNLSDAELARQAGIGQSTVNDLTRGITTHPTVKTLSAITKALNRLTA